MTALGKMMIFLVLLLSLVWTWLTLNAFVTRNNWKVEADYWQTEAKKSAASANEMKKLNDALRDAAKTEKLALEATVASLSMERDALSQQLAGLNTSFTDSTKVSTKINTDGKLYQSNVDQLQTQVSNLNDRLVTLDAEMDAKNRELSEAIRNAESAQLAAKSQQQRADNLLNRIEDMQDQRAQGGQLRLPGQPRILPLSPNFRGTIKAVESNNGDTLVLLTPGLDAGLQQGSRLSVSRTSPSPLYLGEVVIISVSPKSASGKFLPAPKVRATPEVGDLLTPAN
jgi:hypothetical protein